MEVRLGAGLGDVERAGGMSGMWRQDEKKEAETEIARLNAEMVGKVQRADENGGGVQSGKPCVSKSLRQPVFNVPQRK